MNTNQILGNIQQSQTIDELTTLFSSISSWLENKADKLDVQKIRRVFNEKLRTFSEALHPDDLEFVQGELSAQTGSWRSVPVSIPPENEDGIPFLIPTEWSGLGWDRVPGAIEEANLEIIEMPNCWRGLGWDNHPGIVISETPCTEDCPYCGGRR